MPTHSKPEPDALLVLTTASADDPRLLHARRAFDDARSLLRGAVHSLTDARPALVRAAIAELDPDDLVLAVHVLDLGHRNRRGRSMNEAVRALATAAAARVTVRTFAPPLFVHFAGPLPILDALNAAAAAVERERLRPARRRRAARDLGRVFD